MTTTYKNKTLASLLSFLFGSLGAHRFYLYGKNDLYGWLHFVSLPFSILMAKLYFNLNSLFTFSPWIISLLISLVVTMTLGLKSDEKWDAQFNPQSDKNNQSSWPVVIIVVLSGSIAAMTLLFIIARTFDLMLTGGAYG